MMVSSIILIHICLVLYCNIERNAATVTLDDLEKKLDGMKIEMKKNVENMEIKLQSMRKENEILTSKTDETERQLKELKETKEPAAFSFDLLPMGTIIL